MVFDLDKLRLPAEDKPVTQQQLMDALALVQMENFLMMAVLLEVEPGKAQVIAMALRNESGALVAMMRDRAKAGEDPAGIPLDIGAMRRDWIGDTHD